MKAKTHQHPQATGKRGRKLTPQEKKQMAETEEKIHQLPVAQCEIIPNYGRSFRTRLRTMVSRITDKEFSVNAPDRRGVIIITRLA